jgi:hypothetical protein
MYAVKLSGGEFRIISKVPGAAAIGADECKRF